MNSSSGRMREIIESLESFHGSVPLGSPYHHHRMEVLTTNAQLAAIASNLSAIDTATVFAGLTTHPELQSNLYRLEALVHAFIAMSNGANKPTASTISEAFSSLAETPVGLAEDPAEDVFISCVSNDHGNFRTFEGLWESNAFFLQRFLDIVDGMPNGRWYSQLRKQVLAALRLSEAIVSRADLQKYMIGNQYPLESIPDALLEDISSLSSSICFAGQDLVKLGIDAHDLTPLICDLSVRDRLVGEGLSTTALERHPIVVNDGRWYVMLPSAISAAIRIFLIEEISKAGMMSQLEAQLVDSYAKHFRSIPLLGNLRRPPMLFERNEAAHAAISNSVIRIDEGRFLHLLFLADNFVGAEEGWLLGHNANMMELADEIGKSIRSARDFAAKNDNFKDGMSLIVHCGWGRSSGFAIPNEELKSWRIETLSAPDLTTLSLSPGFSTLALWRLLYARDRLVEAGGVLYNINGLLNLYGWSRELKHHLVPHESVPAEDHINPFLICVNQNSLLQIRQEAYQAWNFHVRLSPDGKPVRVCRRSLSHYFKEDSLIPLYISSDDIAQGRLKAVYAGTERDWWCSVSAPEESDRAVLYHLFEAATAWMHRLVPALEAVSPKTSRRALALNLHFASVELPERPPPIANYEELKALIEISPDGQQTINITIRADFMKGFACETNIAERCIVWAMIKGGLLVSEQRMTEGEIEHILDSIIPDEHAKSFHILRATTFRDYVAESLPKVVTIEKADDACLRIGLGWLGRSRDEGPHIVGVDSCTKYIANLLDQLWGDIKKLLAELDREKTVEKLILNIEAARSEESQWNRTIKACLAQHVDKDDVLRAATIKKYSLNAAMIGSRIGIEMALCECPLNAGANPGEIEIGRLLAYASLMHHLGGWSDAIKYEAMPAEIRISHFGEVMTDQSFEHTVLYGFGNELHRRMLQSEAEKYADLFEDPKCVGRVQHLFKPEFNDAWVDEFGFTIDECRAYIDYLEDSAIKQHSPVMRLRSRDLEGYADGAIEISPPAVKAMVDAIRLWPRHSWPSTPAGFSNRDWQPWKFRRRLSVVERPLIQLDNTDDPTFLVAPGLIREGFVYVLRCCYEAAYEEKRFKSRKMQRWIGMRRNEAGHDFNKKVAERLGEIGWTARPNLKLTEVLNARLDRDYGDIDVLAWNDTIGRVLVIECKDLGSAKTLGEIARQLQEFRGRDNNKGRPDRLKRHLSRVELLRYRKDAVAKYVGCNQVPSIEAHLVFKNLVPVAFSTDDIFDKVTITDYESLGSV